MNIIFLDCTQNYGYQYSAANTKVEFLAKGLYQLGNNCIIHNGLIGNSKIENKEKKQIPNIGDVITYSKKTNQLISWIINLPSLVNDLKKFYIKDKKNIIILEAPDYHLFLIYVLLARIFKYKVVTISHEWTTTISSTHLLRKPSTFLYATTFGYFSDAILPISEFIIKKIAHFKKPFIKIPIIAEYNQINLEKNHNNKYFLYCVYVVYKRTIIPIIDAYNEFQQENKSNIQLILVLSGDIKQIAEIQKYINGIGQTTNIIIKTAIPFKELIKLYTNALALIIPLDPKNSQDEARFSQKIAEYLSSGSPIISNNVGEIKHYFTDKENIILSEYSSKGFARTFRWISKNQDEARQIGINGFNLGKQEFDYRKLSQQLHKFLHTL